MAHELLRTLAPHMIVGLAGSRLSSEEKSLLAEYPFPGVILFERNVTDSSRLMELTRELRDVFREARGAVPVIAADHEGGVISVLGRAIGVPPTQMAAARSGDPRVCGRLFAENARRMRAVGVNMLLGPVTDVNSDHDNPVIGTRSFGEDVGRVSPLVSVAVSTARKEGVLTCLKHFPGHGPSRVDSHLALPVLEATLDQLREHHVPPFASGIAAGAETVMMGHIVPLGRGLPASLDPEIIGGLLRGELGFDGVVVTDALEMEGVKVAGLAEICVRALRAGNDILLFSKPVAAVVGDEALGDAAAGSDSADSGLAGTLAPSRARIEGLLGIAAKKDRGFKLPGDPGVYREIAAKSILVQRDRGPARAFEPGKGFKVVFYSGTGEFERFPTKSFIGRVLRGLAPVSGGGSGSATPVGAEQYPLEPFMVPGTATDIEAHAFFPSGEAGAAIDVVFLLNRRPLAGEAVREICSGSPVVVVAGWPYAAQFVPPGRTIITTWGIYDAAADAVSQAIVKT